MIGTLIRPNADRESTVLFAERVMRQTLLLLLTTGSIPAISLAIEPNRDVASLTARPSPEWVTSGVMYQIQPRAFTPEGTLKAATARLPKVAEMGVDIIYMCPVFVSDDDPDLNGWSPRQKKSGMNNPRNPYRMKDYYHVDPEYGRDDDLKELIATAHNLGMRVLLDMVYLHCGPNAVFLKEHPNFVQRDDKGNIVCASWNFPKINMANLL
jgi:1,4-alpha-glucan branching enzyme